MTPTIGRIVIFHPAETDKEARNNGATELPAVIVRVWSESCVNLKVLTDGPTDLWRTSVGDEPLTYEADDGTHTNAYFTWPERVSE